MKEASDHRHIPDSLEVETDTNRAFYVLKLNRERFYQVLQKKEPQPVEAREERRQAEKY